ncbi:amidase signature domain-containing protein [Apodospora peruviana]|uniref:Amidase signature domain-containing protein n=1 Tax=Apodospora peruviana TaxID=516989 RepID=A0AAE0HWM1_9PEZI|nr:amidase signature domain-containing protein [Apodospora peruviana]
MDTSSSQLLSIPVQMATRFPLEAVMPALPALAPTTGLIFTFGSDTNGSGRKPASYNGCFSIRPSTGLTDNEGVVGFFPEFDMLVFFGRDVFRFSKFITVWYGDSPMLRSPTPKVRQLYPADYLPTSNPAQTSLIDSFVKGLESALQVTRIEIPFELWKTDQPDGAEHRDIAKYLDHAGIYPFYRDQYHNSADFSNEYKVKFGKPPFVHRALHWQWGSVTSAGVVRNSTDTGYLTASSMLKIWTRQPSWSCPSSRDSRTTAMRNSLTLSERPYGLLDGYATLNMSPMMRAPEVTAPLDDIPYQSIVTGREEPLPIVVSVMGPPGAFPVLSNMKRQKLSDCDTGTGLILVDLVEKGMKAASIPTKVKTGRSLH